MDVESVDAPIVSADLTLAAEILAGLHPNSLSTFADCALDRFGSLGVGSFVGHTYWVLPKTRATVHCSAAELPRNLVQREEYSKRSGMAQELIRLCYTVRN